MADTYHHGDLKIALMEHGIELLNEVGEQNFSLRKLSKKCGVSHAAPYNHYKNKDELMVAMREYVTERFYEKLNATLRKYQESEDLLVQLGITYIEFFIVNPQYYSFLYSNDSNKEMIEDLDTFKPYQLFHRVAYEFFEHMGLPKDTYEDNILVMWSLIHGLTYVFLLSDKLEEGWKLKVAEILKKKVVFN